MGIRDDHLEAGLFEAFRTPENESVLGSIERLHGAGSSILLREAEEDTSPILIRRADGEAARDDSRYQVLGEIARGGIGVVYRGRDKDLNRDVALKVLRPEYAGRDDVVRRFIEEAQVGGQLQHPGIVPIYGIGLQEDGRPRFAMKLIRGQTLAELLHDNPREVDLLSVFEQITQTMAYAHSRGVIHRDLKPANVMVGAFGEVQVVDWGFAKVLGQEQVERPPEGTVIATVRSGPVGSQSVAGSVMGTPAYMPPEQAMGRNDDLDERSDVFALGGILCELLTGKAPYTGEPKDQLIAAVQCRLDPALERLQATDAPDELKQIVRDCLEPLTADRPRNARVVAERLATYLANVEARARTAELDTVSSQATAAREQHARKRALALATAALLLIGVGGGGLLFWMQDRDAREASAAPQVAAALREAMGSVGKQDWTAAASAAQRAVDIAASEGVGDAGARSLLERVEAERVVAVEAEHRAAADDALLAELEEIRGRYGQLVDLRVAIEVQDPEGPPLDPRTHVEVESRFTVRKVDDAETDAAYAAAFGRHFQPIATAERLAASRHAEAFAANLGFWAWIRKTKLSAPDWAEIDRLGRRVDAGHEEVRNALLDGDVEALLAVVETRGDELPPQLAAHLGLVLVENDHAAAAAAFLERQCLLIPDDFWIRMRLVAAAHVLEDPVLALRHATAALAVRETQPAALWHVAAALEDTGDQAGAVAAARRMVELAPEDAYVRTNLGGHLANAGAVDEAVEVLRQAIALDPEDATSHIFLGNALSIRGEHDEAIAAYGQAIELQPEDSAAHTGLGRALTMVGDEESAVAALRRAVELDPESDLAHLALGWALERGGDGEGGLAAYRRAVALEPKHAELLGAALARRGDVDGALATVRRGLELVPDSATAYERLGGLLAKKGDRDGELAASRKAVALDPSRWLAHLSIAKVLYARGDTAGAVAASLHAVEAGPDQWYTHASRAVILLVTNDVDGAIRATDRAIALGGPHGIVAGILETESGPGRVVATYRRATDLAPRQTLFHAGLGRALFATGDFAGAAAALRFAVALGGQDARTLALLGSSLREQGDVEGALECLRRAVELDPRDATLLLNIGRELGLAGDLDGGVRILERALEIEPENVDALRNLGYALRLTGDLGGALAALRRARDLAPGHAWTQAQVANLASQVSLIPALARVLDGEDLELPPDQRATLALMLYDKRRFAMSTEMYARAFADDESLAFDLGAGHRYWAACAAALAGSAFHAQALGWLRADLDLRRKQLDAAPAEVARAMAHWREDVDLASMRDVDDLAEDYQRFWTDVDALLERAREVSR